MNVLKKYTWLVGTLKRAGDKGLTLEQIGDRWNATEELHEEGAFARRSFHRHRIEIMDLFGIEIECYIDGGQYPNRNSSHLAAPSRCSNPKVSVPTCVARYRR